MLRYLEKVVFGRSKTTISADDSHCSLQDGSPAPSIHRPFLMGAVARLGQVFRSYPRTTVLLLLALIVGGAVGGSYLYADHEWRAAKQALAESRLDDARSHLNHCLFFWPRSIPVHLLAARADRIRGDVNGAEAHLNECQKINHGSTEAIQLEWLLLRVQRGEEDEVAVPLLAYVEKKDPETPVIMETLCAAYIHRGRYGPAHYHLTQWIELTPDAALPYYWRGWVSEQLNAPEDAMKDYNRALELDPDMVSPRLAVAELLLDRSDVPAALPHVERLRKQFPDRPDIMARLGQCRFAEGNLKESRLLLEAAEKDLPNDRGVLVYLAKLDVQEGRPAEAETRLRRVLKIDPFLMEAGYALVDSLRLQGREQDAAAALDQVEANKALLIRAHELLRNMAEKPTKDAALPSEAGILLLRMGNDAKGVYWLNEALRRDPRHVPSLKALAEYYEGKGDTKQAAVYRGQLAGLDKKSTSP